MSVCIIGAGGGGVNRVERIIFPAGRTGNVKKAFFSYILLGKPACDMVSFAWKAARTAAAACETGRAVCGCGAVKGPVVPWNGEQGRIAALNFVSLRFCAFFVAAVFVYYVLPRRARQPWLLACSCFFYMCWNPAYIVLILFSAFSTYLCGRALAVLGAPAAGNRGRRRAAMAVSLAANLGILFFFKYYNFFAQSANGLLAARGFPAVPLLGVLLPVGISFYTFQAIGYTVDVYRGSVSAEQRFWRYLLFISFFPQLVAGPIERSGNILPQLQLPARFFYERAKSGLVLMLWGYIQKMVVADRLALLADTVYAQGGALGGWATAAATVLFCFELYCDFSSYTDIARGAARICAENGVPVLDYNTPGGRDIGFDYATDLADHAHVNTAGAQKMQHGSGGLSGGALRYARQARRRGLRGVGRGGKDGAPGRTEYNVALHAGHGRIFPPADAG